MHNIMDNLLHIALSAVLICQSFVSLSALPACQEPENIQEIFRNLTNHGNMDFILPPSMQTEHNIVPPATESQYLTGEKECPNSQKNVQVGQDSPLSSRSICPFYFVTTHDSLRYPASITEARCSCSNCLDYDGLSARNVCEPVYRNIKVIVKTTCEKNIWQYKIGTYRKQESCTCALRREVENGHESSDEDAHEDGPVPM